METPILTAPREEIEALQLEGVKKTLITCYENIPFYKKSFDEAGFDPYAVESLADVAKAPFCTKQDMRDAYPYEMLAVPLKDVKEIHMSSGTTGVATVGAYTDHDLRVVLQRRIPDKRTDERSKILEAVRSLNSSLSG